jgi:hypothetical protein
VEDVLRYGVFRVGQFWSVTGDDGTSVGFPTRERAMAAALAMVEVHRAFGRGAELIAQDESGQLAAVPPRRSTDLTVSRGGGDLNA